MIPPATAKTIPLAETPGRLIGASLLAMRLAMVSGDHFGGFGP
jgi:hypothetical protein